MIENTLPYRRNVGILIFNQQGQIFIARRSDSSTIGQSVWQCPQGGIDEGEDALTALWRETQEETGLTPSHLDLLEQYPEPLFYDLPQRLIGKAFGGKYRGQKQYWFALRFHGDTHDIQLNHQGPKEFDDWKWFPLEELPKINDLKSHVYAALSHYFRKYTIEE